MAADLISGILPWAGLGLLVLTALMAGLAVYRSQAVNAWRTAAEGYKEQVSAVNAQLVSGEQELSRLEREVARLEALPDTKDLVAEVRGLRDYMAVEIAAHEKRAGDRHEDTRKLVDDLNKHVEEIAERWG